MLKKISITVAVLVPIFMFLFLLWGSNHPSLSGMTPMFMIGHEITFDLDQVPQTFIQDKVFLVTGANVGLGFETAKQLAQRGGIVVIGCRTAEKCQKAKADMKLGEGQDRVVVLEAGLDLGSLESVKAFVQAYQKSELALDVLILNAGIMACPYSLSQDGIEMQMAVNHFGHAALTFGLLEKLAESKFNPRIVIVSSAAHRDAPEGGVRLSLEQVNDKNIYDDWANYGQSKLANILFGRELQRKLDTKYPAKSFFVNIIHPGLVKTNLGRHMISEEYADLIAPLFSGLAWDSATGAQTQIGAAVDPSIEEKSIKGAYFVPVFRKAPEAESNYAKDQNLAKQHWEFTVSTLNEFNIKTDL